MLLHFLFPDVVAVLCRPLAQEPWLHKSQIYQFSPQEHASLCSTARHVGRAQVGHFLLVRLWWLGNRYHSSKTYHLELNQFPFAFSSLAPKGKFQISICSNITLFYLVASFGNTFLKASAARLAFMSLAKC